jgi:hypothetical protein
MDVISLGSYQFNFLFGKSVHLYLSYNRREYNGHNGNIFAFFARPITARFICLSVEGGGGTIIAPVCELSRGAGLVVFRLAVLVAGLSTQIGELIFAHYTVCLVLMNTEAI